VGAPTIFLLLRHGETPLTGERRFSGSGGGDPALSELGRAQAELAARELAASDADVEAVVSSPLARCRQTAEQAAALLGLDVAVEPALRETDFGMWDGLTFAEARQRDPDALTAWLGDPAVAPPGGESFDQVTTRVAAARDTLLAAHRGRTVLLVSHVTPIKTLVRLALGAPPEALFRLYLAPAALSAIAYYGDGNASVRYVNATGHLRGSGA
jgi:probable phosphoglycerate mutase